jgi:hypothetical protein
VRTIPLNSLSWPRAQPTIANIQLDAERLDITSPDLTSATAISEIPIMEHPPAVADVEMGEPVDAQRGSVSHLLPRDRTDPDSSNLDF